MLSHGICRSQRCNLSGHLGMVVLRAHSSPAHLQTPTDQNWFQGTADAVRQYAWLLTDTKNRSVEDVVILSGDHLYRMDYMR